MAPPGQTSSDRPGPVSNPFRQVLVGWDGSPGSVAALRTAAAIVGDGPGRVIALAVLPRPPRLEEEPGPGGPRGRERRSRAPGVRGGAVRHRRKLAYPHQPAYRGRP